MGRLIGSNTTHVLTNEWGLEDFGGDALPQPTFNIPVVTELPAITHADGQGLWKTRTRDAIVGDPVAEGVSPETIANIVFYGQPSGMLNDVAAVTNPSGCKRWEPSYPASGDFDDVGQNTDILRPGIASGGGAGFYNGYNALYYEGAASGNKVLSATNYAGYFDGTDTPYTWGVVFWPEVIDASTAHGLIACGRVTTTQDLLQLGIDPNAVGNDTLYAFRRDGANNGVLSSGTGDSRAVIGEPQMIFAVCSGTKMDLFLNGSGVAENENYDVGANVFNLMTIGSTIRNNTVENPFRGFIFEVCLFDAALLRANRSNIEKFWSNRYNIQISTAWGVD
jgi:hypothetical protein